ncbi:unnamed protein product [Amoebophrya sp. A120]|nr:unnamed protein product [Amoebophrya sp. A120]|eukprot:GSA120T00025853001.1
MTNRLHNAAEPVELPSCKTDAICGHKSATQEIFENLPRQYGEGGFFLTIAAVLQLKRLLSKKVVESQHSIST